MGEILIFVSCCIIDFIGNSEMAPEKRHENLISK